MPHPWDQGVTAEGIIRSYKEAKLPYGFPPPTELCARTAEIYKAILYEAEVMDETQLTVTVIHCRAADGWDEMGIGFSGQDHAKKYKAIKNKIKEIGLKGIVEELTGDATPHNLRLWHSYSNPTGCNWWCSEPKAYQCVQNVSAGDIQLLGYCCFWFCNKHYLPSERIAVPNVPVEYCYMRPCDRCETNLNKFLGRLKVG
ncbi:MAG: hypothetical protein J0I06_20720 [Planctomycetes bacterium]|nr:hypothetical protein [Planctomycetota bacterium]